MVEPKGKPYPFSAQSCWFPAALEPRVALLLMALQSMGAAWMVEQPVSSLAFYPPATCNPPNFYQGLILGVGVFNYYLSQ